MRSERVTTGVPGLDELMAGGLRACESYLLLGRPGTGKTTIGLQFLMEGARRRERCLYVCMAETRGQLEDIAKSYSWSLDGIEVRDMRRGRSRGTDARERYTVFSPSEVELEEVLRELVVQIDKVRPARLVLDSLSEIRLLAEEPARYRRELLELSDAISGRSTSLLIDVVSEAGDVGIAETLVSGVILLEHLAPTYGGDRRRLQLRKVRASRSLGGYHDFAIGHEGVDVYPRLVAGTELTAHSSSAVLSSGVSALDTLLGGGLSSGTSTLLMGAAGTGKSTVAAQFVAAAAARGQRVAMFCFDESPTNLVIRTNGLGIPLGEHVKAGTVDLIPVEPAEYTPGRLAHRIRQLVASGVSVVVLDSVNGYGSALLEEQFLSSHLHELLAFLAEKGAATICTLAEQGLLTGAPNVAIDISHLADTVILFRHFEEGGETRQALSVVKKRTGNHERSIRELSFGPHGLAFGPPLTKLPGDLTGRPRDAHGGDDDRDR